MSFYTQTENVSMFKVLLWVLFSGRFQNLRRLNPYIYQNNCTFLKY